eukprot:1523457-Prymnesium_polylepis.2
MLSAACVLPGAKAWLSCRGTDLRIMHMHCRPCWRLGCSLPCALTCPDAGSCSPACGPRSRAGVRCCEHACGDRLRSRAAARSHSRRSPGSLSVSMGDVVSWNETALHAETLQSDILKMCFAGEAV